MAACGMDPSGRGRIVTDCLPSVPVVTWTTSPVTRVTVLIVGDPTGRGSAVVCAEAAGVVAVSDTPAETASAARQAVVRAARRRALRTGRDDAIQGSPLAGMAGAAAVGPITQSFD